MLRYISIARKVMHQRVDKRPLRDLQLTINKIGSRGKVQGARFFCQLSTAIFEGPGLKNFVNFPGGKHFPFINPDKLKAITSLIAVCLFSACEKVVEIDLNEANPKVVIEGNVMQGAGNNTIMLTKTDSYFESNEFELLTGVRVIVTDHEGDDHLLTELTDGIYSGMGLDGTPGGTYRLNIELEGQSLSSTSTMPSFVKIDSLSFEIREGFRGNGGHPGKESYIVRCHYQDDAAEENYYKFNVWVNGKKELGFLIQDDELNNGKAAEFPFFRSTTNSGDTVRVQLLSIDEPTYTYFTGLSEGGGFGGASAAPGNPQSNIEGDALGYFSAGAVDVKTIILP